MRFLQGSLDELSCTLKLEQVIKLKEESGSLDFFSQKFSYPRKNLNSIDGY